jgi:hypothetical protein
VAAALDLLGGAAAVADPNYADPYATVRAEFASRGEVYFSPAETATAATAAAAATSAALIDPVAIAMAAQAARAADPNYIDPALYIPNYVDPVAAAIAAANARISDAKSAPNSNRFENEADAITYAQNSGQGALKVSSSGAITNQYGETMVYDSSGNLAPAPRMTPVEDEAAANAAIAAATDPVAIAKAAQAAREADPNWVDPALNDPNYVDPVAAAIAAAKVRADAAQSASNSSRFDNETDAIDYAQNSGQGDLKVSDSGAITNQHGETMVYDSDGNLAPAPMATPVVDEAAANAAIAESRAADLVATPFATAESSASLQVLGIPEFNLSTDLFI